MKYTIEQLKKTVELYKSVTGDNEFSIDNFISDILNVYLFKFYGIHNRSDNKYYLGRVYHVVRDINTLDSNFFDIKKPFSLFKKSKTIITLRKSPYETLTELLKVDSSIHPIYETKIKSLNNAIKNAYLTQQRAKLAQETKQRNEQNGNIFIYDNVAHRLKMPDTRGVCLVHVTRNNPNNTRSIETTSHFTNGLFPRGTIHFSLNHIVRSHSIYTWDDMPYVILAPFDDTVKINDTPAEMSFIDTYFSVDPDKGLILPDSAIILEPHDNIKPLYVIGPKKYFYKSDNFTNDDIEILLNNDYEKQDYEKLSTDNQKKYLITKSRDHATKQTIKHMGYEYIDTIDFNPMMNTVANDGKLLGYKTTDSQYGHYISHFHEIESSINQRDNNFLRTLDGQTKYMQSDFTTSPEFYDWAYQHILGNQDIKKMPMMPDDPEQIKKLKEKYNCATEQLLKRLRNKIKTPEQLNEYISELKQKR